MRKKPSYLCSCVTTLTKRFDAGATLMDATKSVGYGDDRSLMLFGIEGDDRARLSAQTLRAQAIGVLNGGLPLGKGPGASWKKERFRTPYLRDFMLDQGVAIDTMETALRVVPARGRSPSRSRRHAGRDQASRRGRSRHGPRLAQLSGRGRAFIFVVVYPVETERRARAMARDQAGHHRTPSSMPAERFPSPRHRHRPTAPWLAREKGAPGVEASKR